MTQITSALPGLDHFDCEGDPVSVGARWEKWKRALEIYFLAANIQTGERKRATLLHIGGLSLQDIYYNIPGAHVEEAEGIDVYDVAIKKLDEYFSPKQSRYYERYIFRLTKQAEGERFENFLIRLRQQADKCQFTAKDENLIDQIIEKGHSAELRKKILSAGDNVTLQQVINIATTLETVNRQLDMFVKPGSSKIGETVNSDINKVDTKFRSPKQTSLKTCYRCGSSRHLSFDSGCPAKDKNCLKCGIIGHFKDYCRTKHQKRKTDPKKDDKTDKTKRRKLDNKKKETDEVDYVFHLDDDAVVKCEIGGVAVDMLIDSGSKCNIITDKTWKHLKDLKVKAYNQIKNPEKTASIWESKTPQSAGCV
ncbi:uncharacterized protein LOC126370600 [Pectinophora gossypiella]|uniref:uncharacterized protein LOC126370600 n=1 Tax=Pectinophora gossypiella TaxID=13191 RepID=UPI00214F4B38|nr:uncharacterized protein LOC126370600 [Pectinophora gossypiella]